jgi:hypothetical protein
MMVIPAVWEMVVRRLQPKARSRQKPETLPEKKILGE